MENLWDGTITGSSTIIKIKTVAWNKKLLNGHKKRCGEIWQVREVNLWLVHGLFNVSKLSKEKLFLFTITLFIRIS